MKKVSYHLAKVSYHLANVSYHLAKVSYHLVKVSYHLAKVSYHLGNVSLHPFGKKINFHKIIQSESEKIAILHFKPATFLCLR